MGFWQDLLPAFKKSPLTFVRKEPVSGNIHSFYFTLSHPHTWKAGQHGTFSFPQKMEGRSWRGFSLTSAPGEDMVRIATRITEQPSAFKQALLALEPGDRISLRGPFGPFYLDQSKRPAVFIAGGIGITPYRAMILDALDHREKAPSSIRVLYADSRGEYVFRDELVEAARSGFITTQYLTGDTLPAKISEQIKELGNGAAYYISGSAAMIKSIKQSLKEQGISGKNIRNEIFLGLK